MQNIIKELNGLEKDIRKEILGCDPHIRLNMTQLQIMGYIFEHKNKDVCQKDLESYLGLKKASITGALDSLEEKGLIVRVTSEEDRRKNFVRFSEEQENHIKAKFARIRKLNKVLVRDIPEEDVEHFLGILEKMHSNLKEAKG